MRGRLVLAQNVREPLVRGRVRQAVGGATAVGIDLAGSWSEAEKTIMQVKDVMTADPIAIGAACSVGRALQTLHELQVRYLPVIAEGNVLVGMVSDRELGRAPGRPASEELAVSSDLRLEAPVAEVMSDMPDAVNARADVEAAVKLMLTHEIAAVPVVDDDGRLVGMVSYLDLLREYLPRRGAGQRR
jgi:CBS domain-containing protein